MNPSRHVELDVDIGADAKDWSAIQAAEKLKPVETELRRIEEMVQEIVSEMDYLRTREQKLRDTNESTNERVKWFAFGTMGMLVGLGAWQVVYLRAYFRYASFPLIVGESLTDLLQVKAFDIDIIGSVYGVTIVRLKCTYIHHTLLVLSPICEWAGMELIGSLMSLLLAETNTSNYVGYIALHNRKQKILLK